MLANKKFKNGLGTEGDLYLVAPVTDCGGAEADAKVAKRLEEDAGDDVDDWPLEMLENEIDGVLFN